MKKKIESYTVQETAEMLGVTPKTVWKWIKTGRLKAVLRQGGNHAWRKKIYMVSKSAINKEMKTFSRCLWCNKPIKDAKYKLARKYCNASHQGLYERSKMS